MMKRMRNLKYPTKCTTCGRSLIKGSEAFYEVEDDPITMKKKWAFYCRDCASGKPTLPIPPTLDTPQVDMEFDPLGLLIKGETDKIIGTFSGETMPTQKERKWSKEWIKQNAKWA